MKKATDQIMERNERQMQEQIMQKRLEYFYKDWQPKKPDEASRFAADLHMLVRCIYAEASEPANKQLLRVMDRMPIIMPAIGTVP